MFNSFNLFLSAVFLFIVFSACAESYDELTAFSFETGPVYYEVSTDGQSESESYITDMVAGIQGDWEFMNNFFLSASCMFPLAKENDTETFTRNNNIIQRNSFSFSESNFKVIGGFKFLPVLNPFLGFSISQLSLKRSVHSANEYSLSDNQTIDALDYLMGFKGNVEFGDYTLVGYSLTYQSSADIVSEYRNIEFTDIDNTKFLTEIFLKYWLSNEYMQVGLHVFGGKYMFDKDVTADELLPDTDIKFVGAFLSFKLSL